MVMRYAYDKLFGTIKQGEDDKLKEILDFNPNEKPKDPPRIPHANGDTRDESGPPPKVTTPISTPHQIGGVPDFTLAITTTLSLDGLGSDRSVMCQKMHATSVDVGQPTPGLPQRMLPICQCLHWQFWILQRSKHPVNRHRSLVWELLNCLVEQFVYLRLEMKIPRTMLIELVLPSGPSSDQYEVYP